MQDVSLLREVVSRISPELKKDEVKLFLKKIWLKSKLESDKINHAFEILKKESGQWKEVLEEIKGLEDLFIFNREQCVEDETEEAYYQLKFNKKPYGSTEVYSRQIFIGNGFGEYTVFWSIPKVKSIVAQDKLNKIYTPIYKLNIDEEGIEKDYLPKAIHNKKPGILVTYDPVLDGENRCFLIDGNHRAIASRNYKNKNEFPIYHLNEIQTFRGLAHPYYAVLFLIHLMLLLFGAMDKLNEEKVNKNLLNYRMYKKIYFT